jgi:hypothetical protein
MTDEDKELIGRYMNWEIDQGVWRLAPNGDIDTADFDLNDAGLCVQEVQKRGEWGAFMNHTWSRWSAQWRDLQALQEFVLHLFNAENFFAALAEWLKERGK